MLALDNQQNGVAKLLLERSANPHVWDWWGRTALYIAIDRRETARASKRPANSSMDSSMEMINLLLAAGVDPNTQLNMHRPSRGGNSGRFGDPLLSTGCTPLLRATMGNDMEVVQALLAKGASPNINDMGMTAFLVAAGFGGGRGFGGQAGASGVANIALMDLLLQHGADVNAQVTGTKTYSMRVARAPSTNEGMSALHIAAQSGRADVVRFLLDKGANAGIVDSNGHQPIDLVGISPPSGRGGATPEGAGAAKAASNPANVAEIRELLRDSVSHK
jgi:ankyrin repeat protein